MCGLHIVVHADELEELINYYQVNSFCSFFYYILDFWKFRIYFDFDSDFFNSFNVRLIVEKKKWKSGKKKNLLLLEITLSLKLYCKLL